MSRIEMDEHKEVANGSTLITVLRAVAAPLGVALLSSLVQIRTQVYLKSSSQTLASELFTQQSTLLALHDTFLLTSFTAAVALLVMYFVPKRRKSKEKQPAPLLEEVSLS
jgi:heme/copper-type cytochrome/quinol oxidase subunit 1